MGNNCLQVHLISWRTKYWNLRIFSFDLFIFVLLNLKHTNNYIHVYGVQNGIVSTGNIITKKQHSSSPAPPPILGIHILYIQVLWFAEDNINSFLFFNFNFQVLLLVDASFGFEMETFEFLNICQVHGFPRIMGVLTHLDAFKDNKQMRKTKKRLKHRFWTEVYQVNCLWEIISTGYHIWSNAAILIYILHIKLKGKLLITIFYFSS